jgi:AmmeMemoRadiSam system protein B
MNIRQPAVAGSFYPQERDVLHREVLHYLDANPCHGKRPKALVVPHAGYAYSGPVAARAYNLIRGLGDTISRVVLLGPSHRVYLQGIALPDAEQFQTPLGTIAVEQEWASRLSDLPQVQVCPEAHGQEHSLEVQLPFLQEALGVFTLVPLVVGQASAEMVSEVLDRLWGGKETLIVVSTDLSHYHPYGEARRLDSHTGDAIVNLDSTLSGDQACGCHPLNGLLLSAARQHMKALQLDLRNSGDTAGSKDAVVGYGAYALY